MNKEFTSERFMKARVMARVAKKDMWSKLQADDNCVGAAFGRRIVQGQPTDEPALVIYVQRKVRKRFLPLSRRLPRKVYVGGECVEVDVVETGPIYALSFTARERPAPSGISVGHPSVTAGTLGCLVTDNTDGSLCLLSNNHVLANGNAAAIGDAIIQPGTFDGGVSPADDIAKLKRFIPFTAGTNQVDCAIAEISNRADVVDQIKDDLMAVPSPDHPAVGLLFAGSCNRMFMNPIDRVLAQLDIELTNGPGATTGAEIGMNVEKVGRTTEYTTSTITEIDVTTTVGFDFGTFTFEDQIATFWMADGGDSGSIVCAGGEGGEEDRCGSCGTASAAAQVLGEDLGTDVAMAQAFRDKVLRQTRIGAWAVDLFALNEERFLDRFQRTEIAKEDRDLARTMYAKYKDEARAAFLDMENPDRRVTEKHFRDAKRAFERAQKYLDRDEQRAAEKVFELAQKAKGATAREALAMLEDKGLHEELQRIASEVPSIRTKRDAC